MKLPTNWDKIGVMWQGFRSLLSESGIGTFPTFFHTLFIARSEEGFECLGECMRGLDIYHIIGIC